VFPGIHSWSADRRCDLSEVEVTVAVAFDDQVTWDGGILHLRAIRGAERIRCRAGRETIAELVGFSHASSLEIGERKAQAAELLKASIAHKIEIGAFDRGLIKTVTVFRYDLLQRWHDLSNSLLRRWIF
jgi:hypothetical protein